MIRLFTSFVLSFLFISSFAQAPAGYYTNAEGKTGYDLKSTLKTIITSGHTERSYTNLWTDFQSTDKRADGKVWDMYSNCNFTFSDDQDSGNGGTDECQVYNREHSFPKSWFNDATPMYSDLFHLYPTDKYVNNKRSSYPFGETNSTDVTDNGSKLGTSSYPGYTGIVFEPIDEYKGDFARTYFYMATRYQDVIAGWPGSNMLNKTSDQCFTNWALDMLIEWHLQDAVSTKEINRNNAVFGIQKNRNPYIDHPEWVSCIWQNDCSNLHFTSTAITSAIQDQVYTYNITVDGEAGKTFTISKVTAPNWLTFTQNTNTTATLSGTPIPNNLGENTISLKLSDGTNEVFQDFVITVTDGNTLAFTSTPVTNGKEGVLYSYTINAIGNDGKTLAITAETKPSWLNFKAQKSSSDSETLEGTPTAADLGDHAVSLKLTDGTKTIYQNFTIKVVDASAVGNVIITQYYEGSSGNNKFIEITNVGAATVDLTDYYLGRWSGTSTPSGDYVNGDALTGSIQAGETKVYKNADSAIPNYAVAGATSTTACYFNGDDPVALLKGGKAWSFRIDCIYAAGTWGADKGFYRKPTISQGNTNISVLDGTGEWTPITENDAINATAGTTQYIGYHSTSTSGIDRMSFEFKLYPNPTENKLIVESSETITLIEILSITGQKLIQLNGFDTKVEINTSALSKGIYFIHLTTQNQAVSTQKFIKK